MTLKSNKKINWENVTFFYEDSEGDLNVISEDCDITTARLYRDQKSRSYLKCSLLDRQTFLKVRSEQQKSKLNKSKTWEKEDSYRKEAFE